MLKVAPAKKVHKSPSTSPSSSPVADPFLYFRAYFTGVVPMGSASDQYAGDDPSTSEGDYDEDYQESYSGSPPSFLNLYSTTYSNSYDLKLKEKAYKLAEMFKQLAAQGTSLEQESINEAGARILMPYLPLQGSSWFSDLVVNRWFDMLSNIHPNVTNIHSTDLPVNYLHEISEQGLKQEDRERLQQATTIFWPIVHQKHWYLLVIERKSSNYVSISCMDGFNSVDMHKQHMFEIGDNLLKAIYPQSYYDTLVRSFDSITIPRQNNGDDCGPAICCQGLSISQRVSGLTEEKFSDYTQARLMISKVLLQAYTSVNLFLNGYFAHGKIDKNLRRNQPRSTPHSVIEIEDDSAVLPRTKLA